VIKPPIGGLIYPLKGVDLGAAAMVKILTLLVYHVMVNGGDSGVKDNMVNGGDSGRIVLAYGTVRGGVLAMVPVKVSSWIGWPWKAFDAADRACAVIDVISAPRYGCSF
jgi:hypothetical protein